MSARAQRLFFVIAVAAAIAAPRFLLVLRHGAASIPIPLSRGDTDEFYYLSRVYSCFRGHWLFGFSFMGGNPDPVVFNPNYTEMLMAAVTWPLQNFPQLLAAAATFIYAALAAALLLFVFAAWEESLSFGALGALTVFLILADWIQRPVQPQGNYFIYAACFAYLARLWRAPKISSAAAFGVLLGVMPYLYIFYFLYMGAFAGLLLLAALAAGRRDLARSLVVSLGVAAVVMIPYFHHNMELKRLPDFDTRLFLNGFTKGHFPSLLRSVKLAALTALLLPFIAKREDRVFFGWAFLAGLCAFNQQVVTGLMPHEGEFHLWRVLSLPIGAALLLALDVRSWLGLGRRKACAVLFVLLCAQQVRAYARGTKAFDWKLYDYAPAFSWLKQNAPREAVVAAENLSSYALPVMTWQDTFRDSSDYCNLSLEETWKRNFAHLTLYQLPESELRAHVVSFHYQFFGSGADMQIGRERVQRALKALLHGQVREFIALRHSGSDQDSYYARMAEPVVAAYQEFKKSEKPPFGADYLIYGPLEREWYPHFVPEKAGTVVWQSPAVVILRLRPSQI